MKIYLMQHGQALSKDEDRQRQLSDTGHNDINKICKFLMNAKININVVIHSGKTRAYQTASILSNGLKPSQGISVNNMLNPNDNVVEFAQQISQELDNAIIIGHLPFLSNLVSYLCGNNNLPVVAFTPGSVICLECNSSIEWQINWMITPELL